MEPNPFLGVGLHAAGGFAAGSFYIPYKRVRQWSWESYWLVGGIFSWIIAPWVVAFAIVPDVIHVLTHAPRSSLALTYLFGVLWGIGGLTFGLSMRYLGMSLGYALALGFCAAFGTLMPPVFQGKVASLLGSASGWVVLAGVAVCMFGIAICGKAGVLKEREVPGETKTKTIAEFNFARGVWVAIFAGVMSACMAFAIAAGKPIADLAVETGTSAIWQNTPVFIVVMAGGFTTNCIWCVYLNWANQSSRDYVNLSTPLIANYLYSALGGITWYLQFLFYGMGTTQMGRFDFSSWTLHMAFIILFSNLWGLYFKEWEGSSKRTIRWMIGGLAVLLVSIVVVGWGNTLAAAK
ncbi:MAG: sugar:proton symporter [Candidatus Hydrogenedentota bacterium]